MPNCFQLARKSAPQTPVALNVIDDELCAHFGVQPDPERYYQNWYNNIGLALAMGLTWDQMKEVVSSDPHGVAIVEWFEANFISTAWYQPRSMGQ